MSVITVVLQYALTGAALVAAVILVLAPGEILSLVAGWDRRTAELPPSMPYYLDLDHPHPDPAARVLRSAGTSASTGPGTPASTGPLGPTGPGTPGASVLHAEHDPTPEGAEPDRYLVYLDGIGKTEPRDTRVARALVRELADLLPGTRFVGHVIPYSPFNRPLVAHPRVGRWWRFAERRLRLLMFLRNCAQTLVACDRRYQGAYLEAVGGTVLEHLRASGYRPGSGVPIVLMGYSGGVEVAAGIAPLIASELRTPPLVVVSIGGVVDARSAFPAVAHLYHFRSRYDWIERLGALVFPGRWPFMVRSGWNVARRAGRVTEHRLPGVGHFGKHGYLSAAPVLPDGRSPLEQTLRAVVDHVARTSVAARRTPETTSPRA